MEKVFVALISGAIPHAALQAVRAILDFIYLAQYPSHSTTTLQRLQEALKRFHSHKQIFIQTHIREHFQIPKVHAMEHYVASIQSRGTADGFNTELPERLHIDLTKDGYRASSRRDYTIQMTRWLTRQEKIFAFSAYLRWRESQTHTLDRGEAEVTLIDTARLAGPDAPDEEMNVGRTYHLAKHPGYPHTPLSTLATHFHAHDFLPALSTFLILGGRSATARLLNEQTRFDLYKRVTFSLQTIQQIDNKVTLDVVRATPFVPRRGRTPATPAHFDTVLIHYSPDAQETGVKGEMIQQVW